MQPTQRPAIFSTQVREARYYVLNLHPDPTGALTVVCGGCETCMPDYEIHRESFAYSGLEFVASGRGELKLAGRTIPLRPGMVFSYGPTTRCHIRNDPGAPLRKYFVDFVGTETGSLLNDTPLGRAGAAQLATLQDVADIFDMLYREGTRGTALAAEICTTLLRLLLLKVREAVAPEQGAVAQSAATYLRCRDTIDRHFLELSSLTDIAASCHVDPSYLCRLFRRFNEVSPYRYLMQRKMNRAVDLLLGQGLLVKETAAELGFKDPYHFSRVFKSVYGVSPLKFVKQQQRGI